MLLKKSLIAVAMLAVGGFAATAGAVTTQTAQFQVKIAIQNTCDVTSLSASDMDFGTHTYLDSNINATSTIQIKCTNGNTYHIGLDAGANAATPSDTTTRRMTDGTNYVPYQLYTDNSHTTPWGNSATDGWIAATGTGAAQSFTVYGQATPSSSAPAGNYADTVTATVTF
jgi:spore coat protein U-like protein